MVLTMDPSASFPVLTLENPTVLFLSKEKNGYKSDMTFFNGSDTNLILPYTNDNEVQVSIEPVADGKLKSECSLVYINTIKSYYMLLN
ncbi:unnamed protein product [Dicrocoelium dendriticum]|nr:unnamed protein product [Dicrocoelium dendriticum]